MDILNGLVKKGNTVIVIEHNLDVIKMSDYIIDIGPDGGTKGGKITFIGTVFDMFENSNCITAEFLRNSLQKIT